MRRFGILCWALLASFLEAQAFTYDGLEYSANSDGTTATLTGYSTLPDDGAVTVPSEVSDGTSTYSVTSIGTWAFRRCTALTSLDLSQTSITTIQTFAFL